MMKKRDIWPVVLMSSSIVLLLLLQTLWLVNSYDHAYNDLRRRTSDLFRGTLMEMRDSLFMKTFETWSDSVPMVPGGRHAMFLSFNLDTIRNDGGPRRKSVRNKVVVRYTADTLKRDTIIQIYRQQLAEVDITLPFRLVMDKRMPVFDEIAPTPDKDHLSTEWIMFAPEIRYAAVFDRSWPYLLMQIGPQMLFSFVLTLITSAAFWMMYRSIRSQRRLMELKNDFISNITHELKTPVTTVSVALEALRNFKGLENPQTTKEYLDIAQSELTRLTMLTDKVLKTAVFDNPRISFETEPIDLYKTVDQILHSMKLIFQKQKAHVTFEQKGNSFTIRGGSVHLTNVIYNLLDNALKYSFGEPRISIRLEENDNRVILKVADKGIGIPAEFRKKIFEKFFRVPTGDVHNIKGYGLGLSYVDNVVKSHNGFIEVTSKPGEGSVFTVSLPKGM